MNSRRSFFKRFAAAVAIVALAPQIAFRVKTEAPKLDLSELTKCIAQIRDARGNVETIDVFTDAKTADAMRAMFARYYVERSPI